MDGLFFLLEAPLLSQTHIEYPFPLNPCDNSRFKTTNGVQVKSQPHCETCTGVSLCQLCDQERYFAERSRIVTGASAVPSRHSPSQSIELSAVSPARGESIDGSDRYWGEQASLDRGNQSLYASRSPLYGLSSSPQSNPDQWFSSPLMGSARSHCESGGQHSYTSSLLQLGNDSLRGYYTPYDTTDTPNSLCNRMLNHVLPPSNSHQVNMPHLTMHVHRQNGPQSPNYSANGPKPFFLAGSSPALEVASSSVQRVAPNSIADPDDAITQPIVDAVLSLREDQRPPASLTANTPPPPDTRESSTHFPHRPTPCNADSLAITLETASVSPYQQSPSPQPHTFASHSQSPSSPGSLADVFTVNSQPWRDVAMSESETCPEVPSSVEKGPESATIQQELTTDITEAEGSNYCHNCRVSFAQPQVFRRHLKDMHEEKESCAHCSSFKWSRGRPYIYRRHLELKHPEVTSSEDQLRRARKSRTAEARQRNRKN